MLPQNKKVTYIMLAIILILGVSILLICSGSISLFGGKVTDLPLSISPDTVLIFYAPWCGHCKRSMDDFKDAELKGNGKVILIDADEPENENLKTKYGVQGFPTIIKGDGTKYNGGRTALEILDFVKN